MARQCIFSSQPNIELSDRRDTFSAGAWPWIDKVLRDSRPAGIEPGFYKCLNLQLRTNIAKLSGTKLYSRVFHLYIFVQFQLVL